MTAKESDKTSTAAAGGGGTLQVLLYCYRSLPSNLLRIGNLDITFTIASFLVLSAFRVVYFQLLTVVAGWPLRSKMTTDSASSLVSITHSIPLCIWLTEWFWKVGFRAYSPSCALSSHSDKNLRDAASACLQMCTGYMMFDAIWLIKDTYQLDIMPLTQFDLMIMAHHTLTSFYMTSCRVIGAGHVSAMILMLTGEISNPLMNGMFITRFAIQLDCCKDSAAIQLLHSLLEHTFAVVYIIFRTTIGPVCSIHLAWDVLFTKQGRQNIPLPLSIFWVMMIVGILIGSGDFVMEAVDMLQDGWDLRYTPDTDFGERYRIQSGDEL